LGGKRGRGQPIAAVISLVGSIRFTWVWDSSSNNCSTIIQQQPARKGSNRWMQIKERKKERVRYARNAASLSSTIESMGIKIKTFDAPRSIDLDRLASKFRLITRSVSVAAS
jgi:hypothetical protein